MLLFWINHDSMESVSFATEHRKWIH